MFYFLILDFIFIISLIKIDVQIIITFFTQFLKKYYFDFSTETQLFFVFFYTNLFVQIFFFLWGGLFFFNMGAGASIKLCGGWRG